MDKEPIEPTDSDQPRYPLRNRTTTVSASSSQVTTMSHANLPAIDGRMAEGRSEGEATDASQGSSLPREMPQLSPILEVEQDSQTTSSVIRDTPPTLQPVTISPYARVTLDTDTQRADSQHRDYIDARCRRPSAQHTTTQTTTTTTTTTPLSKITLAPMDKKPNYDPDRLREVNRDCSILRRDEAVLECTPITEVLTRTEQTDITYLPGRNSFINATTTCF